MVEKVKDLRMTHTKHSLINGFFSLVNKKDFEQTTIADITKVARINRGTFYAHFKDKYDLINYIMADFATFSIDNHVSNVMIFNQESITKIILAVHGFYQEPNEVLCQKRRFNII